MATDREPLLPDAVTLTAIGLLAGVYLGGPVGAALLGAGGLVVGTRLDTVRTLASELEDLKEETETETER